MEIQTKTIEEIRNLSRKADQTRSMHGIIKNNWMWANRIIMLYVAIGSAIIAMFIFASVASSYQICIGIFSASIFIASIIPGTLNFGSKILERTMAVQRWGEWVREASNFCNVDVYQMNQEEMKLRYRALLFDYKEVMGSTPPIPDNKFNKYKQLYLQKVEISKALDKTPFKSLKEIKKDLSKIK